MTFQSTMDALRAAFEVKRLLIICAEHDRVSRGHAAIGKPRAEWRIEAACQDRARLMVAENLLRKAMET